MRKEIEQTKYSLKICFVSQEYPPETGWGGIGSYVYEIAHALHSLGHTVVILSRGEHGNSYRNDDGVEVYRVYPGQGLGKTPILWRLQAFWDGYRLSIARKLEELNRKYMFDIIETTDIYADLFWHLNFRRRQVNAPVVIKLHCPRWLVDQLSNNKNRFWNWLQYLVERQSIVKSDKTFSCSQALLSRCADYLPKQDYPVVYNPINVESISPCAEGLKENVLSVGRIEWKKGVQVFAAVIPQVCSRLTSTTFTLVGPDQSWPGGPSLMGYIRSELPKAYEKNLDFTGGVSREEVLKFLMKRPICVFPSLWENFPYTCLEAMSYGCAVIGSKHGGMSEMIIDGESGVLIDPENPEEISRAVLELLEDTELRKMIGDNAARRVREEFNSLKIAQQTLSIYRQAIDQKNVTS